MVTAPDDLERTIEALKKLLSVVWTNLANPLLTPFERRGARNQIKEHGAELRRYLQAMEARRARVRNQSLQEQGGRSSGKPMLRLVPGGS
jgi:hypothetical protein